jgi:hypothetical protein
MTSGVTKTPTPQYSLNLDVSIFSSGLERRYSNAAINLIIY